MSTNIGVSSRPISRIALSPQEKADGMTVGACSHCTEHAVIYRDTRRCRSCDSEYIYCEVCQAHEHQDSLCRHLWLDECMEAQGSGTGRFENHVRDSLFRLLDLMPAGFAEDLRRAIVSTKFYTFLSAPMIGGGGHLELHGTGNRQHEYGCAMVRIGEDEEQEETAGGYGWLASLYLRKTLKANRATVSWIDAYLKRKGSRHAG